mgnify:CR=1 FL=1
MKWATLSKIYESVTDHRKMEVKRVNKLKTIWVSDFVPSNFIFTLIVLKKRLWKELNI